MRNASRNEGSNVARWWSRGGNEKASPFKTGPTPIRSSTTPAEMVFLRLRLPFVSLGFWLRPCVSDGIFKEQKFSHLYPLGFVGSEEDIA